MAMTNKCGPPIPWCMVKGAAIKLLSPGLNVVVPTNTSGGQHPSNVLAMAGGRMVRVASPTLRTVQVATTCCS